MSESAMPHSSISDKSNPATTASVHVLLALATQWADTERKIIAIRRKATIELKSKLPSCDGNFFSELNLERRITKKYINRLNALLATKAEVEAQLLDATADRSAVPT